MLNVKKIKVVYVFYFLFLLCFSSQVFSKASSYKKIPLEELKKYYKYDKKLPLKPKVKKVGEWDEFTKYHITYNSTHKEKIPAFLYIPKQKSDDPTFKGPWPVVFFMHFHVSDKSLSEILAFNFAASGIAVFAIDGIYRGERKSEGKDILMPDPRETVANIKTQVFDILRGFDYLETRKDLDLNKTGFLGISMGAITGTIATALDDRIKVIVLADGGGDMLQFFLQSDYGDIKRMIDYIKEKNLNISELQKSLNYVDPIYFAPYLVGRPTLMINGKKDTTVPVNCINALYEQLGGPNKYLQWYNSDHILPPDALKIDALTWFKFYFFPKKAVN